MPTDAEFERCVQRILRRSWTANQEERPQINQVREMAEKELGLEHGHMNNDAERRAMSIITIKDAMSMCCWMDRSSSPTSPDPSPEPQEVATADTLLEPSDVITDHNVMSKSGPTTHTPTSVLQVSTASSSTTFEHPSRCLLLELPLEIQVMIYKMAFITPHKVLKTITIGGWAERYLEGPGYWISPFPALQVEKFLVSKAFFQVAAKAYVESQRISFGTSGAGSGRTLLEQPRSILCRWVTTLFVAIDRFWDMDNVSTEVFVNMKWLEVELDPSCIGPLEYEPWGRTMGWPSEGKFADVSKDIMTDEDLYFSTAEGQVHHVRGLVGIQLLSAPADSGAGSPPHNSAERTVWQTNLGRLEEILNDQVTLPRDVRDVTPLANCDGWDDCVERQFLLFERFLNETREDWV